jgi:mono/diheme cytochrome c family protein
MDIGLPVDVGFMGRSMVFSHAFLQEGFALVTAKGAPVTLSALRGKRVAVQLATPPQSVVAGHDDITGATFLDPDSAVQALADGKVDAAFVWGPSAGYLNHVKLGDRFAVTPVSGEGMQYNIGVGFARKQTALRDQVDAALPSLAGTVTQLAAKYGFPAARPIALSQAETPAPLVQTAALTRLVVDHPAPAPVVQAAAMVQTTDDQKDAADRVAGNAGAADLGFKPASGPQAVAEGRTIFNGTCNHCHGPDAEQSVRKIDLRLLQHRYGGAMDQVFHYTVTHGRESKGMPNWSGVFSEDDFSKILAFLHSVQTPSTN